MRDVVSEESTLDRFESQVRSLPQVGSRGTRFPDASPVDVRIVCCELSGR